MSKYRISLDGKTYEMDIELMDGTAPAAASKKAETLKQIMPVQTVAPVQATAATIKQPVAAASTVTSPMPGTVLRMNVSQGDMVKHGQAVMVLEAMKMENEINAPKAGKITVLYVKQGDSVQGGDALFEIEE